MRFYLLYTIILSTLSAMVCLVSHSLSKDFGWIIASATILLALVPCTAALKEYQKAKKNNGLK
jgi:hypothetical protein